jgi:EAL domain-containing protein (putative c-di-GMP-specific phosphodiesterase class I)/GGDEF domain-containing protein
MDCCKSTAFYSIKSYKNTCLKAKRYWLLLLCFVTYPSLATQNSILSPLTITAFAFGLILPFLALIIWKFLKKLLGGKIESPPCQNTTSEELSSYPYDLATNLPVAQHALKRFDQALKATKNIQLVAVVFKPINFQQVNTILGHHNSDILLLQLAFCLQQSTKENPHLLNFENDSKVVKLARLHGLDFLAVFDLSDTKHDTKSVIDNLCRQLSKAIPDAMSYKSFSFNFELAFGVAVSGEHGNNANEIVSYATDALLKGVKNSQSIQYFDHSSILYTEQQLHLMECLRQDILSEDFRWYLQPQINIDDNSIIGFELKVHWYVNEDKVLELIDFIDLAEHSGEVYRLTKQMFEQAFKSLSSMHKLGVYQKISVNLSSKNLLEPDLVDFIERQMQHYNIAGKYLMIELSEQVMISACQRAKDTIDHFKSLGITISIDNFSGSYESLRYLRKMAIHQVRINCIELERGADNRADKAIINALITLARSMNLPIVATNINKHETLNSYKAMGGNLVQGDFINKGVVPDEIEIWLKRWFAQHPESNVHE